MHLGENAHCNVYVVGMRKVVTSCVAMRRANC